ncbi:MAG: hypothetical protein NWE93_01700 [Candidatus Bathyarchaeota archaeon]|nr:hypothetical protein [Candidatus Bathyarchaeota archaeon]
MDNQRFGIKLPDRDVEKVLYAVRSSSGFVVGVPNSNRHLTLIPEGESLSVHLTYPPDKRIHLGRIDIPSLAKKVLSEFIVPTEIPEPARDDNVLYFTEEFSNLFNSLEKSLIRKSANKDLSYLDIDGLTLAAPSLFQPVVSSPQRYFGRSSASDFLSNSETSFGLLDYAIPVVKCDGDLFRMSLPFITSPDPISSMLDSLGLKGLGMNIISEDILKCLNVEQLF